MKGGMTKNPGPFTPEYFPSRSKINRSHSGKTNIIPAISDVNQSPIPSSGIKAIVANTLLAITMGKSGKSKINPYSAKEIMKVRVRTKDWTELREVYIDLC